MKLYRNLLLVGIVLSICACPQQSDDSRDLGNTPNDLAVPDMPNDLSVSDGPTVTWTTLSLLAGGIGGNGNADDTGAVTRFSGANAVALDGAGNLYVADTGNETIRKITLATGVVTTIAGSPGIQGSADGIGTAARFGNPYGLAADSTGKIYVADAFGTIRQIVLATGTVSTIASGAGQCGTPISVSADGTGNLFVTDSNRNIVCQVVLATGVMTTIAGSANMLGSADGTGAAARFSSPRDVTADSAGNLYVADTGNSTIRKIVIATGAVTTIAGTAGMSGTVDGTGTGARFSGPLGVMADNGGNLYIADGTTIRKMVLATGVVTTIAGTGGMSGSIDGTGAAARFSNPKGIVADSGGNLYVADSSTIRKIVDATGVVTTIAGTASMQGSTDGTGAAARFNSPFGAAADGAGNIYVADTSNLTIRKVVLATGVVTTLAGTAGMSGSADGTGAAARFRNPYGVAADNTGNLYIADTLNKTIRKIVVSTGVVTTIAGTAGIQGSADGTGAAAQFDSPSCVAADGAGNIYVADIANNNIRKIVVSSGVVTTIAGTAGVSGSADGTGAAARFLSPFGIATDGAGNLYIADTANHTIRKIVVSTGVVTTIAGTAGMSGSNDGTGAVARFKVPYGVTLDSAGNLYVADTGNATIRRIVLTNGSVETVLGMAGQTGIKLGPIPARLSGPVSTTISPTGELIISDDGENSMLIAR